MYKQWLESVLRDAEALVVQELRDEISFKEFVTRYDNFYYSYALDGHEAGNSQKAILNEFKEQINFHSKVQNEVVDLACFEEGAVLEAYLSAGRIPPYEGRKRLKKLASKEAWIQW